MLKVISSLALVQESQFHCDGRTFQAIEKSI